MRRGAYVLTPRGAAIDGALAFGASEVKGIAQHDDTRRAVTEVGDQLVNVPGVNGRSIASTSNTLGKSLCGTDDALCQGTGSKGRESGDNGSSLHLFERQ